MGPMGLVLGPQPQHKPQLVGTEQPTVPHTGRKDPIVDMPDTLPGNWYRVLGVRYPGATMEEIKRAYKQLSVKVHLGKNTHHTQKAEGLFKQIGKAKDRLSDTEARDGTMPTYKEAPGANNGRYARAIGEQRHMAPSKRAEGQGSQTR